MGDLTMLDVASMKRGERERDMRRSKNPESLDCEEQSFIILKIEGDVGKSLSQS